VRVRLQTGLLFEGSGLKSGQFDQVFLVLPVGFAAGEDPIEFEFWFWRFGMKMIIGFLIVLEIGLEEFEDVLSLVKILPIPGS
jgi:hypothetical protein